GERIMEILKQPQHKPMPVEKQVLILYVLVNKHLLDVDISHVREFQKDFLLFIEDQKRPILEELRQTGDVSPTLEEQIKEAIREFKQLHSYR
ncbi:MAG: F0F1 ATP synthase subunit alpha, partial [Clostridiales bacterium]|nr:F0F1 ATP synthase subunit alpha [Clostridiales bacterium]